MGKASRDKGVRAEREVCAIFNERGFDVRRVPNSGGLWIPGDVAGLQGFHVEVKRQERLDVPAWVRQAYADSGNGGATLTRAQDAPVPVVAFRRSTRPGDPLGIWHAVLPLVDLARLIEEAQR